MILFEAVKQPSNLIVRQILLRHPTTFVLASLPVLPAQALLSVLLLLILRWHSRYQPCFLPTSRVSISFIRYNSCYFIMLLLLRSLSLLSLGHLLLQ